MIQLDDIIPFGDVKLPAHHNMRDWRKRAKLVARQREIVHAGLIGSCSLKSRRRVDVLLVRIAPRLLDEGDNVASSLKGVRDEVAAWIGVDDRDPAVRWYTEQEQRSKWRGVRIVVAERESCECCGRSMLPVQWRRGEL